MVICNHPEIYRRTISPREAIEVPSHECDAVNNNAIDFRRTSSWYVLNPTWVEIEPNTNGFRVGLLNGPIFEEKLGCCLAVVKVQGQVESFLSGQLRYRRNWSVMLPRTTERNR